MTTTTSKLGADMTDEQREAIESGIAAMEKCGWTHRVPVLRALLARQPAAIGKPAAPSVEQDERGASFEEWIESVPPLAWENWGRREAAHAAWQARAASTSANVAQGAEAVGFRTRIPGFEWVPWLTDDQDTIRRTIADAITHGSEASALYAAPPAQTALTDDARDAARWRIIAANLPTDDLLDIAIIIAGDKGLSVSFSRTAESMLDEAIAAQSASGDTK